MKNLILCFLSVFLSSICFSQVRETNSYNSNGQRQGLWIDYYPNGKMKESIVFVHDTVHRQIKFWPNGMIKSEKMTLYTGVPYSFTSYTEFGAFRDSGFNSLSDTNTIIEYDDLSFPIYSIPVVKGLNNGTYYEYYPNGKILCKGRYLQKENTLFIEDTLYDALTKRNEVFLLRQIPLKDGTWCYFDQLGKIFKIEFYKEGNYIKGIYIDTYIDEIYANKVCNCQIPPTKK